MYLSPNEIVNNWPSRQLNCWLPLAPPRQKLVHCVLPQHMGPNRETCARYEICNMMDLETRNQIKVKQKAAFRQIQTWSFLKLHVDSASSSRQVRGSIDYHLKILLLRLVRLHQFLGPSIEDQAQHLAFETMETKDAAISENLHEKSFRLGLWRSSKKLIG